MLKECRVIYTFHGLPYDCTCVEPLPTQDQSFLLCSSHLLFHFSAQSPRIFVLNDYGAQYVAERAAQFPKSVFNDRRVIARSATPAILDNVRFCLLGREHVDATTQVLRYAAVKGNGVMYALAATVAAERLERLELAPAGDVGTDVSCAVAMEASSCAETICAPFSRCARPRSLWHTRTVPSPSTSRATATASA